MLIFSDRDVFKNFGNEKISLQLKIAGIDMGVNLGPMITILDIKTHFLRTYDRE